MSRHYRVIIAPLCILCRQTKEWSRFFESHAGAPVLALFARAFARWKGNGCARCARAEVNSKEPDWLRGMANVKLPVRIWLSKVRLLSRKLLYERCGSRLPLLGPISSQRSLVLKGAGLGRKPSPRSKTRRRCGLYRAWWPPMRADGWDNTCNLRHGADRAVRSALNFTDKFGNDRSANTSALPTNQMRLDQREHSFL